MIDTLLKEFGKNNEIDWKLLKAILMCESGAKGFKNGSIQKRFEERIYNAFRLQKHEGRKNRLLPGLSDQWVSSHSDEELEMISTSWGIAQIMGYHYKSCGYDSIKNMVDTWSKSEETQVNDFLRFITRYNNGRFLRALKAQKYSEIAQQYNGPNYAKNKYEIKLQQYQRDMA